MGENATFRPILIADCEGFGAEFQTTNSARALSKDMADKNQNGRRRKSPNSSTSSSPSRTSHNEYGHIQEDAGLIINAPIKASKHQTANKSGIELYYARFLYAMSDVVVFVTDNDGQVAANLTRILEWAVLAVHKSVNNPSRKTLILVQNKYDNFNELGDGEDVARTLFTRLKEELWQDSPELRAFVKKHNQGQTDYYKRIRTNDALFHFLFESVKCCLYPGQRSGEG